jgi:hypothetical protein
MSKKKEKKLKLQRDIAIADSIVLKEDVKYFQDLFVEALKANTSIDRNVYVNFEHGAVFCKMHHQILMAPFNNLFFSDGSIHWTIFGNVEFIRDYKEKYFDNAVLISHPQLPLK